MGVRAFPRRVDRDLPTSGVPTWPKIPAHQKNGARTQYSSLLEKLCSGPVPFMACIAWSSCESPLWTGRTFLYRNGVDILIVIDKVAPIANVGVGPEPECKCAGAVQASQ